MTTEEFSNEFDNLVNSNSAIKPMGVDITSLEFDEYEKSVFLTKAQESIVISLYNGSLIGNSFEETEELRRYLSSLVKTYSASPKIEEGGLTKYSYFFSIPKDILAITYEAVESTDERLGCSKDSIIEVVPTSQDELHRTINNPFRRPGKRRVLRLDRENDIVELISMFNIDKYQIRYLSRPEPIILVDLPDGLTIGKTDSFPGNKINQCKLNPAIHRLILEMAVNLALKSKTSAGK